MRCTVRSTVSFLVVAALSWSCGSGVLLFGSDTRGEDDDPAVLAGVSVSGLKASPAQIKYSLTDQDGGKLPVVELFFEVGGAGAQPVTNGTGTPVAITNAMVSKAGAVNVFDWDFAADLGPGLATNISVVAQVQGTGGVVKSGSTITPGANSQTGLTFGNVPVGVQFDPIQAEFVGNVATVTFEIRDPTPEGELVDVRVEFSPTSQPGARQLALAAGSTMPDDFFFLNENVPPSDIPGRFVFSWDFASQLGAIDEEVQLHLTVFDKESVGLPDPNNQFARTEVTSPPFRIDNNLPPLATLGADALFSGRDVFDGVPIPLTAIDAERDETGIIVQWRSVGQSFPALPDGAEELTAIAASPGDFPALQVATELPRAARGTVRAPQATSIELPELGTTASFIDTEGIEGREVEILRSFVPEVLLGLGLDQPADVLACRDTTAALVLDRAGGSNWRLRELDLASGEVRDVLVEKGNGVPIAMDRERGSEAILVLADTGGSWAITRFDPLSRGAAVVVTPGGGDPQSTPRELVSRGPGSLVVAVDNTLLGAHYRAGGSGTRVLGTFATPLGLAVDPYDADRIYVAERDFAPSGRITVFDVERRTRRPLKEGSDLVRPHALAIDADRKGLLFVQESGALNLVRHYTFESAEVTTLASGFGSPIGGMASGADRMRIVALTSANGIAVGGGVQQRRGITGLDRVTKRISVTPGFDPVPAAGSSWRIPDAMRALLRAGGSNRDTFVWNSSEAIGGETFLRVVPFDNDKGSADELTIGVELRSSASGDSVLVENAPFSGNPKRLMAAGDLDGDGDVDIVQADYNRSELFVRKLLPGRNYGKTVIDLGVNTIADAGSSLDSFLDLADLNGDGRLDVIFTNAGNALSSLLQSTPGNFNPRNDIAGGPVLGVLRAGDVNLDGSVDVVLANKTGSSVLLLPLSGGVFFGGDVVVGSGLPDVVSIEIADLDVDGLPDVIVADRSLDQIHLFRQDAGGTFESYSGSPLAAGTELGVRSVRAADLDGDGLPDVTCVGGNLRVFFQRTSLGFGGSQTISRGGQSRLDSYMTVRVADASGDGRLDLFAGDEPRSDLSSQGNLDVYFQEVAGGFSAIPQLVGKVTGAFVVGDLDGDGGVDFAGDASVDSFNGGSDTGIVFSHLPAVGGTGAGVAEQGRTGRHPVVGFADLDDDGLQDLVTLDTDAAVVRAFPQTAAGVFASLSAFELPVAPTASSLALADLDADGDQDLLVGTMVGIEVYLQQASGDFGLPGPNFKIGSLDMPAAGFEVVDLDTDGRIDVVSARGIFFQGAGGFPATPSVVVGSGLCSGSLCSGVAVGDVNGDGFLDVVSGGNALVQVFHQGPGRQFGVGKDPTVPNQSLSDAGNLLANRQFDVVLEDFDRDGRQDIAAATLALNGHPAVWFGRPGGYNDAADQSGFSDFPGALAAGDLNADGLVDLVMTVEGSARVFFQREGRRMGFDRAVALRSPSLLGSTRCWIQGLVLDLDGDARNDVVTVRELGDVNDFDPVVEVFFGGR